MNSTTLPAPMLSDKRNAHRSSLLIAFNAYLRYNTVMTQRTFKSILITGASSGIGHAVALGFAKPGVHLTITGRHTDRLHALEAQLIAKGANVTAQILDVVDRVAMIEMARNAEANNPFDLVIANAGIASSSNDDTPAEELIRDIFDVNLAGVLNTVLPAATLMRARGAGHIAIVSSIAGLRGLPTAPAYSASKVAVKAWGEAMRPQLAANGVGMTIIIPGFVESRITDANTFPMPFIMPAEKAAKIIVSGLQRRKRTIAFPWQMVWLMRCLTSLPGPIFDTVLSRGPKKA